VVWGLAYGAVPVCSMTWFAQAAPEAREAATVVFTSSFQAMLSVGALLGGLMVDSTTVSITMLSGGLLAVVTAVLLSGGRTALVLNKE
jgi:predicted MFS family arabinose efflux permease